MPPDQAKDYASQLSDLARQLNAFAAILKVQHSDNKSHSKRKSESPVEYLDAYPNGTPSPLFPDDELQWLETIVNI